MKTARKLPDNVVVRLVSWDGQGILDVHEFQARTDFRAYARTHLGYAEATDRKVEVFKHDAEDDRCRLQAKLTSGVPLGCRVTQPAVELEGVGMISLDRFWDVLVESVAELTKG